MYQTYWGLAHAPFQTPQAQRQLAASAAWQEAIVRLDFVLARGWPLGLVVGPAGSGKSALLRQSARQAARRGWQVAALPCAAAEERDLVPLLARAWKVPVDETPDGDGAIPWSALLRRWQELALEEVRCVIFLDDLDAATPSACRMAERLLALAEPSPTLIVSARPTALDRLGSRLLEHVALRIDLAPLSPEETAQFVTTALTTAGRAQPVFREDALRRLHELSGGWPRNIEQLAELALVAGASQHLPQIDADTLDAVQQELCLVL